MEGSQSVESMSGRMEKRDHIVQEILSTERTYVSSIGNILKNVHQPLLQMAGTSQELLPKGLCACSNLRLSICLRGYAISLPLVLCLRGAP